MHRPFFFWLILVPVQLTRSVLLVSGVLYSDATLLPYAQTSIKNLSSLLNFLLKLQTAKNYPIPQSQYAILSSLHELKKRTEQEKKMNFLFFCSPWAANWANKIFYSQ